MRKKKRKQPQPTKEQYDSDSKLAVGLLANPIQENEPPNSSNGKTDGKSNPPKMGFLKRLKEVDGLITAIGTLLLFFATVALYCATRDLVHDARDTSQRQLRAYVLIDKASVTLDGRTLKAAIDLKNFGQTPAYDAMTTFRLETRTTGEPFVPASFTFKGQSRSILGPGVVTNPQAIAVVPPENNVLIPNLQSGAATLYLVGQIEYRDAFDRIWILDLRMQSFGFDGSHWRMYNSEEGNKETQGKELTRPK